VRDHLRRISQGPGVKVDSAVEGLKLLAQGKAINYEGASGPCDFTETGDILDCKIRFEQAEKGKFKVVTTL
jgi:branched-chain amino acid transport system substrate-binding protein